MRKNRKSSIRKERAIMLASSAFVLAALTMTGLYMRGQEIKEKNDGYTLDFTALENNVDDKLDEIAQNQQTGTEENGKIIQSMPGDPSFELEDDLDYMPLEAGSDQIEIPGLTDHINETNDPGQSEEEAIIPVQTQEDINPLSLADSNSLTQVDEGALQVIQAKELHFSDTDKLSRPVAGDIIIPYSMDKSVYFETLDQYKYNPATIFGVAEGTVVSACAAGKVTRVFDSAEIGHAVTIDLGDGYQVTYGQLTDIQVNEENYVEAGDRLGTVAAPTKYYVSEGSNLYFQVERNGQPINPETMF